MSSIPEQKPYFAGESINCYGEVLQISGSEKHNYLEPVQFNFYEDMINSEETLGSGADTIEVPEFRYTDKFDMILSQIPGLSHRLIKPIPITIKPEENFYFVHNDEFDINEGGTSIEEALKEFYNFFINDLENWINSRDKELSKDARELKAKYLEYVDVQ